MIVGAWIGAEVEWSTPAGRRYVQVGNQRIEIVSAEELIASLETEAAPEGAVLHEHFVARRETQQASQLEERTT